MNYPCIPMFEDISPGMPDMGPTWGPLRHSPAPALDEVLGSTPDLTNWLDFPDGIPDAPVDFLNSVTIKPSAINTLRQDATSLPNLEAGAIPQPLPPPPAKMGRPTLIQELEKARDEVKKRTSELAEVNAELAQLRAEIQREYKLTINLQKRRKKSKLKEGEVQTTECIGLHRLPDLFKHIIAK